MLPPILYEDDHLIAWDKPSGLAVAPDRGDRSRVSLMAAVHDQLDRGIRAAHRLDAEASGIVLTVRDKPALDRLSGQFQAKTVECTYLALVLVPADRPPAGADPSWRDESGRLREEFAIELGLGPDAQRPGCLRVVRGRKGKASVTHCRVRERFRGLALLEGRTRAGGAHQVRAHLAAVGAPVLNDSLYGDPTVELRLSQLKRRYKGRSEEKPLIKHLALHAVSLEFDHPATGERLRLESPLPHDFGVALKYLRKFGRGGN